MLSRTAECGLFSEGRGGGEVCLVWQTLDKNKETIVLMP